MSDSQILDLDAFVPVTVKKVKIEGVTYGVIDIMDVSYDSYLRLLSIDQHIKDKSEEEQLQVFRDLIRELVPSLSDDVLKRQSLRRIALLVDFIRRTTDARPVDPLAAQPSA